MEISELKELSQSFIASVYIIISHQDYLNLSMLIFTC